MPPQYDPTMLPQHDPTMLPQHDPTMLPQCAPTRLPQPIRLDIPAGNRCTNWELFKQSWQLYAKAAGLEEAPEELRVATLLSVIGSEALQVYNHFEWYEDEDITEANILDKFESYCRAKKNVSYERYLFMNRKQGRDESIDEFAVALRILAMNCDYGYLTDSIVRDAIIMGVHSYAVQECLLRENNPSLETCINIVKTVDKIDKHTDYMRACETTENIEIVKPPKEKSEKGFSNKTLKKFRCQFCRNFHRRGLKNCPANGMTCYECGGKNHFQSACLNTPVCPNRIKDKKTKITKHSKWTI